MRVVVSFFKLEMSSEDKKIKKYYISLVQSRAYELLLSVFYLGSRVLLFSIFYLGLEYLFQPYFPQHCSNSCVSSTISKIGGSEVQPTTLQLHQSFRFRQLNSFVVRLNLFACEHIHAFSIDACLAFCSKPDGFSSF